MEINKSWRERISLKKSHKIILLIIGILIMLVVIAFVLKNAYRLGQQNAPREENQTNQRAK
jgi:flagellar basal body-associated protein FliL